MTLSLLDQTATRTHSTQLNEDGRAPSGGGECNGPLDRCDPRCCDYTLHASSHSYASFKEGIAFVHSQDIGVIGIDQLINWMHWHH